MQVVRGRFRNGVVEPLDPVDAPDGSEVELRFVDPVSAGSSSSQYDEGAARLIALLESSLVSTGVTDLADEHDHYIHGSPKHS